MRTHLLQALPAIETGANGDTGIAANDNAYVPARTLTHPSLLVAIVNVDACEPSENASADEHKHDDYYLGGYAGI